MARSESLSGAYGPYFPLAFILAVCMAACGCVSVCVRACVLVSSDFIVLFPALPPRDSILLRCVPTSVCLSSAANAAYVTVMLSEQLREEPGPKQQKRQSRATKLQFFRGKKILIKLLAQVPAVVEPVLHSFIALGTAHSGRIRKGRNSRHSWQGSTP